MLAFFSFSPTEFTDQKQLEYNFYSEVQVLDAADKIERERKRERERERETEERHKTIIQVPSTNRK